MVSNIREVLEDLNNHVYVRKFVNPKELEEKNLAPNRGERFISPTGNIKFDKVSVITPNGDILVNEINIDIEPTHNLMIVGPNGCDVKWFMAIMEW